jgi:hypothetical protein
MTNVYNLKIHEEIIVDNRNSVLRVPGGWIYKSFSGRESTSDPIQPIGMVYVPYDDEFLNQYNILAEQESLAAKLRAEAEFTKLNSKIQR